MDCFDEFIQNLATKIGANTMILNIYQLQEIISYWKGINLVEDI